MVTTEAYVVHEPNGGFHLETVHYSDLTEHELLIEAVAASICHTDILAQEGGFMLKPPMIPGHEAAGIVRQVGSKVKDLQPGDSVVLSYASCRACKMCLSGRAPYCHGLAELNFSGTRADGSHAVTDKEGKALSGFFFGQSSFSRLILAHESSVVGVDATREELKLFAALGCGIQTGCGAIFNVLKPPISSTIAIFGAGAVGLSALHAAALTSPTTLILIDTSATKLASLPRTPATHLLNPNTLEISIVDKLLQLTDGQGVDYIIDAVGSTSVLRQSQQALAKCGTLLTLGGDFTDAGLDVMTQLIKGATYRGSHQGDSVPGVMIPRIISLWREGRFPFQEWVAVYGFEELERALRDMRAGRIIKPVLTF